ncbi:MAG: N-acetylglucosamine-6-phosphate deacetylase [Verrucomicrobia bacterium]|nr:N-acetylglucosamine-6-phosphate deacetylase [Verrucomicrobiota bacterium]NBU10357.1 N-acetylglucosamine-6-phosphate deacetylase [Pseudomonadota bacterium]NDA67774.1 N-acetylglucosamine-6-phosphate deacetylase [Verrucomicrobiota bacterium]NDB74546.1 N-acetylglucosamine-6-phosphate deacetylase [Verrucomicrobiota bacterium]NDD37640.1 N-acetylglucosamine-6-phosphate deacetylase [Verrucomicrobiota bacterium]
MIQPRRTSSGHPLRRIIPRPHVSRPPGPPTWVFHNGTVVLPYRLLPNAVVICVAGRITHVGRARKLPLGATLVDAKGGYISPGFVDIHVHGGDGADFMDGTVAAVRTACRAHARHGTTTIFPTTTTGSPVQLAAMLAACGEVKRHGAVADGARIAGVHFYGPYFAPDKVGCHSQAGRRDPDAREYRRHFATGIIRIATCAAELPGAEAFYREATGHGCLVTCGHSNATWAEMARAFRAGMRHVDHFWCAMSSVASLRQRFGTPMQASMEQFVLANPEMSTEVIADGCHLSPELLEFAYRQLGPRRLCLVTDANRALDMPPGRYRFGCAADGEWIESDGRVGFVPGGGALASSVVGLDAMVRHMKTVTTASLPEVIRMASLTPAERAGVANEVGSLAPGKRADVLVLNQRLRVKRVFLGGEEVSLAAD